MVSEASALFAGIVVCQLWLINCDSGAFKLKNLVKTVTLLLEYFL